MSETVLYYVCMSFMALITAMVSCAGFQDSVLSVPVGHMSYSRRLDLRAEASRVPRHVKPHAAERQLESLAHIAGSEAKPLVH